MRIIYHPDAEAEFRAALDFYEGRVPGLGLRFLKEFDRTISEIQQAPERWPVIEEDLRCRHASFSVRRLLSARRRRVTGPGD